MEKIKALEKFLKSMGEKPTGDYSKDMKLAQKYFIKYRGKK